MTLEQAERLNANEDFAAFIKLLQSDAEGLLENLIYGKDPGEIMRVQEKIIVLRGVTVRLKHLLADLQPEAPASLQDSEYPV
jgi:hypothetical protein